MISGKKIAVFGFGIEGYATVKHFYRDNHIEVFDEKPLYQIDKKFVKFLAGKHIKYFFARNTVAGNFDLVIHSAGVRRDNPRVQDFIKNGASATSATQIFFDHCKAKIIGVTGTKGKGTTSTLIHRFLKESGRKVFLAGNIGTPMLEILSKATVDSLVVLELSSFQLQYLTKSPHIAVVLMVTSEHMDWHKSQEEYLAAKQNIVKHQNKSDFAVINADFENSKSFATYTKAKKYFVSLKSETNGAYLKEDNLMSSVDIREKICEASQVLLPGRHNLQNVLAAICAVKLLNVGNQSIKNVITTFSGLPYRLERVGKINGITYYNDSFSTTPETTIAAIEAFSEPKILILGGSSKKSDFLSLAQKIAADQTVKKVVLIGTEAARIKANLIKSSADSKIVSAKARSLAGIIAVAKQEAQKGDLILLSPACASFDMFKNYKDRGDQFKKEVENARTSS